MHRKSRKQAHPAAYSPCLKEGVLRRNSINSNHYLYFLAVFFKFNEHKSKEIGGITKCYIKSRQKGSNPQPIAYKTIALPIGL